MGAMKGDFLGFTFDGIHSSELGIMRVSDGSRYSENLLPTFQDKTVQIPGNNGMYYHGSYYTQRQFNIAIAFDSLTEEQLRRLKLLFSDKKIHSLIFDEVPYKVYKVKITGTPNLKYVCFDKGRPDYWHFEDKQDIIRTKDALYNPYEKVGYGRIYKGEGQLNFVAYTPFAKSRFKYINQYKAENIPEWGSLKTPYAQDVNYNLYDWRDSVNLILSSTKRKIGEREYVLDTFTNNGILIYNPGDFDTDFILKLKVTTSGNTPAAFSGFVLGDITDKFLRLVDFELFEGDSGVQINTKLNLIEGIDQYGNITGTIYNKYLTEGDFFKIVANEELIILPITWNNVNFEVEGEIDYQYLFI